MSKKFNIKGIFFDLDGTILDTKGAYLEAARAAFLATGQQIPHSTVALEIPRRLEQKQPISDIVKTDRHKFLKIFLKSFYEISRSKSIPIPGTHKTLELLSRKTKLSMITLRYAPSIAIVNELEQFGLSKYFSNVITALDTDEPKPSPKGLIKAVTAMNIQTSDCLVVGDSILDIKMGEAAGVKTVAVLSGLYSRTELSKEKPHLILNDISELPKFIQ